MKYSVVVNALVGMVAMMVVGCGNFGSSPQEETRVEYSKYAEGKLGQLLDTHAKFVVQVQQRGLGSERQAALDATLDDLTKKGEAVQRQIEALKASKGQDWLALQFHMNQALQELAQSYDKALAQFAG